VKDVIKTFYSALGTIITGHQRVEISEIQCTTTGRCRTITIRAVCPVATIKSIRSVHTIRTIGTWTVTITGSVVILFIAQWARAAHDTSAKYTYIHCHLYRTVTVAIL
jgi:hypothetical protein